MTTSAQVRDKLVTALKLDLVGPSYDDVEYRHEILSQAPTTWYLTGFLAPNNAPINLRSDDTGDDELDQVNGNNTGDDETTPEKTAARKGYFPVSMGLSFLVSQETTHLDLTIEWGDYVPEEDTQTSLETPLQEETSRQWQRIPQKRHLTLDLAFKNEKQINVPDSDGLKIVLNSRPVNCDHLVPPNTRTISIFLVNNRPLTSAQERDLCFIFQTTLKVNTKTPFVPRPNLKGQNSNDPDEKIADLQYRDDYEYVVGHNVSAIAHINPDGTCHTIETAWIPQAEVEKVIAAPLENVELGMEAIADAPNGETVRQMIGNMVIAYGEWIKQQQPNIPEDKNRKEVAQDLLNRANIAKNRIETGLTLLDDPQVLEAFQIANRAIATAIRQRATHESDRNPQDLDPPKWRPFQLAFILMNLKGIVDPTHHDRDCVDLLFFPTGGGKTEAYLGLAAFTLVLRRLKNPDIQGAGVSVIMRYTLRLLTLDQLGRAATLICALELERQNNVQKLGKYPFEIGLWVGQSATPNVMGKKGDNNPYSARARTIAYQNDSRYKPSPIPLENCPWCGEKFTEKSFSLQPHTDQPKNLSVICGNRKKRQNGTPQCVFRRNNFLPIVAVDDSIYRRLPCFIIATVDKFANLPWVGATAALFGKVQHYDPKNHEFYTTADDAQGVPLKDNLPPPDLIIQDELHLISGPLGTMVGLYETAIDALCSQEIGVASSWDGKNSREVGTNEQGEGFDITHNRNHFANRQRQAIEQKTIRPKIIASTATVRRASQQIQALFGRTQVDIFPPPGIDRRDTFFAKTVPSSEKNARLYLGIAAQGRSLKVVLLRTYLALLGVAQKEWQAAGGKRHKNNPADPYMTLLGYFNSLRELGGSRRIVEDEVNARLTRYSQRKRVNEEEGLFSDRKINDEPRELTSRETTNKVAETKRRLALTFEEKERVDVALATNMISVGLDITRLGLMVVLGQPKTAAEYIQATSRVGRDENKPGLVITLLNIHRPRDRSHYERFAFWHTTFYRAVEATSVTPFSPRAVDRGLAGITVALARLGHSGMTPPLSAANISKYRQELDYIVDTIVKRVESSNNLDKSELDTQKQKIRGRVISLLDSWERLAMDKGMLQYQKEVGQAPPLLYDFLDNEISPLQIESKFRAGRSLRDVEPTVNLWVRSPYRSDFDE